MGFLRKKVMLRPMKNVALSHVTKTFMQAGTILTVLDGVTATFNQGVVAAITGVSGSGKSTLLHLVAGLDTPDAGTVSYDGKDLGTMTASERQQVLNTEIGLIFQLPYLITELSVLENVMLKGLVAGKSENACASQAMELLAQVGLQEKAYERSTSLSGGQQQRVALARGLFGNPTFMFADEPTGNLDRTTGKSMIDLLLRTVRAHGAGLIVVSHDPYVEQVADQVWHLSNGRLEKIRDFPARGA